MGSSDKQIVSRGKPKGDIYYDNVASNYEVRRQKQAWWHVEHKEMKSLLSTLPDGLSVVDVPFGTGRFVKLYREKNFDISGLDASGHMISTAKDILGDDFTGIDARIGSAMNLPFADEQFDLVVSTRFLSDIIVYRDAKKVISEFSRVTKKYAIIQLGQNRGEGFIPGEDSPMGGLMSETDVAEMLEGFNLRILDARLVLEKDADSADMYHFLCEKV